MTTAPFQMTQAEDGSRTLTFLGSEGSLITVTSANQGFDETFDSLMRGDVDAATVYSVPLYTVTARLSAVDPNFGTDGDVVTYEGRALASGLANTILRYARLGSESLTALGRFVQRLAQNPSARSSDQLYGWVEANGLSLTPDGLIVGYKGVRARGGKFVSVHSGTAFVNGVRVDGQIPNAVGDVITMPRNQVQDDPSVACHQGLHVGSHNYASGFGQHLLTVHVDPADVVSVPDDCGQQKMRVCRYTVVGVNTDKRAYAHGVVQSVEDYSDYCECGCHD